jgi:hypothetical protein
MPDAALLSAAPAGAASRCCELADVLARYGDAYRSAHRLTLSQCKAMWAITHCRTATMGGQRQWCAACGLERYVYHSCRNRHCPKCQSTATADWVRQREDELLPVPYFHNVFTLPHELNALLLFSERNRRALLKLFFDGTAQTLLEFGRREFNGKIGFTLVLHTWDQQLRPHFHLHALIASGALSADGTRWIAGGRQFLFPVRGLSKMFRAKYLDGLADLLAQGKLDVPPQLAALSDRIHRRAWLRRLRKKPWVVYSQRPFAGPKKLIDYLGRYTHRTAIANHRILACDGGQVRFTWRDRRDRNRRKVISLPAEKFIHRFLAHVLPERFMRIRHYGLLANRGKKERLAHVRRLLGSTLVKQADHQPRTAADWMQALLGVDIHQCPSCGGLLATERLWPGTKQILADGGYPQSSTLDHSFPPWDTS